MYAANCSHCVSCKYSDRAHVIYSYYCAPRYLYSYVEVFVFLRSYIHGGCLIWLHKTAYSTHTFSFRDEIEHFSNFSLVRILRRRRCLMLFVTKSRCVCVCVFLCGVPMWIWREHCGGAHMWQVHFPNVERMYVCVCV